MEENFNNKISRLELENFTCFTKAEMDFSSGINVFIGENGTGKTHILKAMYAMTRKHPNFDFLKFQMSEQQKKGAESGISVLQNIVEIFKEGNISRNNEGEFSCKIGFDESNELLFKFSKIGDNVKWQLFPWGKDDVMPFNMKPFFIPSTEMLSWFKGFVPAYEQRENSFDATFYDLGKALSLLPLRHNAIPNREKLLDSFVEDTEIMVSQLNGEFYVNAKNDKMLFNSSRAASGVNKLGEIIYLISNGSITNESVIFWDEPETNLNPKYVKAIARLLQVLAKNGVQIFVATHDYYLSHLLSLNAEYRDQTDAPPIKFFSLFKGENGTDIESADTIAWLKNNAIVEEYAHFYDLESQLFANTMKKPEFA
jgi:predicted ATPase